jgi:hypothetical protein
MNHNVQLIGIFLFSITLGAIHLTLGIAALVLNISYISWKWRRDIKREKLNQQKQNP